MVFAAIAAAAIVAWWHCRSITIWYDEAITLLTTSGHAVPDWTLGMEEFRPTGNLLKILLDLYNHDVHPPLYFWTLALWRVLFGGSLEIARALSALFTLATVGLLYRYAALTKIRWAFVPAVLYALSAAGLRYAYNARPYAMATFLIVLTIYLSERKSQWVGCCAAAAVATHYFSVLCVGPIVTAACVLSWKTDRRWAVLTGVSFLLLSSPLSILVLHTGSTGAFPHFEQLGHELHALVKSSVAAAMPSASEESLWQNWRHWNWVMYIVTAFAIMGTSLAIRRKQFLVPWTYAAFLGCFFAISIVTDKSIAKMPAEYYVGIATPFFVLLVAYGVNAIPTASPILALCIAVGTVTSTKVPMWRTPDYRLMIKEIRSECSDCAIVVGTGWGRGVPGCVLYEAKANNVHPLRDDDDLRHIAAPNGLEHIVYFIPANEPRTAQVEGHLLATFRHEEKRGYYKVEVSNYTSNRTPAP